MPVSMTYVGDEPRTYPAPPLARLVSPGDEVTDLEAADFPDDGRWKPTTDPAAKAASDAAAQAAADLAAAQEAEAKAAAELAAATAESAGNPPADNPDAASGEKE